jgi:hypothetical protein
MPTCFWSNCRGKSIGRVIHALNVYCGLRIAEECQVGNNKVYYPRGKLFATYIWNDEDTPVFFFEETNKDFLDEFSRKQTILKPFLDEPFFRSSATFIVQEIRSCLSFDQALFIRFVRDQWNGDWSQVIQRYDIQNIITQKMISLYPFSITKEIALSWWKHFALCAILDI